ncbi:uncharacterized protein TNCV_2390841 [Trichonephila clavipes]|nr:uncharacterized protein TNCV_2390841 [Trichonephila clavipes]
MLSLEEIIAIVSWKLGVKHVKSCQSENIRQEGPISGYCLTERSRGEGWNQVSPPSPTPFPKPYDLRTVVLVSFSCYMNQSRGHNVKIVCSLQTIRTPTATPLPVGNYNYRLTTWQHLSLSSGEVKRSGKGDSPAGLKKNAGKVLRDWGGHGSRVVKVSDRGWPCHEFEPITTKDRRVGERCTLNLSRAQTSTRWCGVVVRRGGSSSGVVHVT